MSKAKSQSMHLKKNEYKMKNHEHEAIEKED
jgi:hypothetical protein